MKATFKKSKAGKYQFGFSDLKEGAALALCHALSIYSESSPVCEDLRCSMRNAIQQGNDQDMMDAINDYQNNPS